jgi:hypothetical protein
MQSIPYVIKTNGSVTLYMKNECLTVAPDHPNYTKIIDAIKASEFDKIENLVNIAKAVVQYAKGQISIQDGQIFYGTFALHNTLTNRILAMMNEGFKFDHMVKFLENLMENPSHRAVNETYTFLENYGLPITDDGCFLAYKAVRGDYKDIYSGKMENLIGATLSIPRNMVDETYERDCSTGLHVGALDYVVQYGHFVKGEQVPEGGNRLLIVKVNPKDVVSVPRYESHPKMRVSQYTVVSEITNVVQELDKVVYTASAQTINPDDQTDWDDLSDDDADGTCDGSDTCSCDDDDSDINPDHESEYKDGYDAGASDSRWGHGYQSSLDLDASEPFKQGYQDGFESTAST